MHCIRYHAVAKKGVAGRTIELGLEEEEEFGK